jgi:pimeloyl-ACP methyl ester carboxylesterase
LGLEETDLVGYSMGAVTALRFAGGDRRIRRLVLGGIGGDPAKWSSSEGEARATRARQWLTGLEADDPSKIEDKVARRARRLFEARHNDLRAIAALLRASRPLAEDITLADVSAPTLVVCGDQDLTPHKLAAALPQGQALVVDGDHERVVRNPELAKAIVNFLAD